MVIPLSDADLMAMRTDTENTFVERKPTRDKGGWLLTAVAFANSVPMDYPAVLFIGVNNDGTIENVNKDHDWEKFQMTVSKEVSRAYPPIYCAYKLLSDDGEHKFLAAIIPGSPQRPHFAGKSYVRVGPETKETSEDQFNLLVAERASKAYTIRQWIGKRITLARFVQGTLRPHPANLLDCTEHYVSLEVEWNKASSERKSYPLNRTEISFNHPLSCLELEVRDSP